MDPTFSSGFYRTQIGLTKPVLRRYIDNANDRDYSFKKDDPEFEKDVQERLANILGDTSRINNCVGRLQGHIDRWATFISQSPLDEKQRVSEREQFQKVVEAADGAQALITEAQETLDVLDTNLRLLLIASGKTVESIPPAKITASGSEFFDNDHALDMQSPTFPLQRSPVQLPRLELCLFNGDMSRWQQFWDTFVAAVHHQPLPAISKLTYLLSTLTGEAKEAVAGYPITEATYPVVVEVLRRRFGDPHRIQFSLHAELRALPKAGDRTPEVRQIFEKIERICRQLDAMGDSTDHPQVAIAIEAKMPYWLLMSIYEAKQNDSHWSVMKMRRHIEMALQLRENVAFLHNETTLPRQTPAATQRFNSSTFAITTPSPKPPNGCAFCHGAHWNDECMVVVTAADRFEKVKQLELCLKCLRPGHLQNQCPSYRPCFHCRKNHNSALCRSKGEHNGPMREGRQGHNYGGNQAMGRTTAPQQGYNNGGYQAMQRTTAPQHGYNNGGYQAMQRTTAPQQGYNNGGYQAMQRTTAPQQGFNDGGNQRVSQQFGQKGRNVATRKVMAITNEESEDMEPMDNPTLIANTVIEYESEKESEANNQNQRAEVLLLSKEVILINPEYPANQLKTIAFLDGGSQLSFITTEISEMLHLSPKEQVNITISTFAEDHPKQVSAYNYEIHLQHAHGTIKMDVTALKKLTGHITIPLENNEYHQATYLQGKRAIPGILIGADYFWEIITPTEIQKLPSGFTMIDSKIGPMLCGKGHITSVMAIQQQQDEMMAIQKHQEGKKSIGDTIEKFWTLETIGIHDNPVVNDDDIALQQFQRGIEKRNGRYSVKWPWKDENPQLSSNYFLCMGRLRSTVAKLTLQPDLLQKYDDIMKEQASTGIIEPVDDKEDHGGLVHYLAHHPVINLQKKTTPIRIVHDGSMKTGKGGKSLNDCLYRGPTLMPDLCGMLFRFRTYEIAIVADIEKAFLQIGLEDQDRDAVRFLWLKDITKPWSTDNIQIYRFCRVAFGIISSPFLLAATIQHHLQQYNTDVAKAIQENIYADNVLMEAKTTEEAKNKCAEAKIIFKDALMNLREFISNDKQVNETFSDAGQKTVVKFLGIIWDTQHDTITIPTPLITVSDKATKREVLSMTASIYDPLGLISPAVLPAKKFLQELWQQGYDWDEHLSLDEAKRWTELAASLNNKAVQLPRKICQPMAEDNYEIHTFVDASAIACAAVIYLRQITPQGVTIYIICAKSRLGPINKMTIPRMELMAALIGMRLTKFITQQIQIKAREITLWSDSKCVLGWIASKSETLPKFVNNRIREIRSLTEMKFRYVPTLDNPADLGSRGITLEELKTNDLWWNGPKWLTEDQTNWSSTPIINPNDLHNVEEETEDTTPLLINTVITHTSPLFQAERWSSWKKQCKALCAT
uniref:CCHC-type domain-containing protein n=1 Tax=Plectus sambesii TaxID=2011161 RepID=A0A914W2D1_9BILA